MPTFLKKTNPSVRPAGPTTTPETQALKNRNSAWLSIFLLAPWACHADEASNASMDEAMPEDTSIDLSDVTATASPSDPKDASNERNTPQEPKKLTPKEQITYLLNNYVHPNLSDDKNGEAKTEKDTALSKDDPEQGASDKAKYPPCTTVYGNPKQAKMVIIIGTSLGCPPCHGLHASGMLDKLSAIAKKKDSAFALILRDYPLFPISMKLSAMVWACGDKNAESLLHSLYHEDSLDLLNNYDGTNDDAFLDKVEAFIGKTDFADSLDAAKKARKDTAAMEAIFNSRIKDQAALSITGAPWAFIMERNSDDAKQPEQEESNAWSLKELELNTLDAIIKKLEPSDSANTAQKTMASK